MRSANIVSIVLGTVLLNLPFVPAAFAENGNELRANEVFFLPFLEIDGIGETTLRIENADRWRDAFDDYFYHHNEFTLRVPVPSVEGLNWESGFRRRDGDVGGQIAYLFNLTWNLEKFCGTEWELRLRNQWELSDPDGSSDQSYKGRFRVLLIREIPWLETNEIPWKFGFGDEFFYEPEEGEISENQLGGGIQIPLSKQALIQIATIWQRLDAGGADSGHDDNFMLKLDFQYHIPRRAKREAEKPIFDENLEKEF